MTKQYWLVKQEPTEYSWEQFVQDRATAWTGIRNYLARNHLRAMRKGDLVAFYHSGEEKSVMGLAQVQREHYPDPTAAGGDWSGVDLAPVKPLRQSVALAAIKADRVLQEIPLIRQSRLSVCPLAPREFQRILRLGKTRL